MPSFDTQTLAQQYAQESEEYWKAAGRQTAVNLFQEAVVKVPAYKKFIEAQKVDPEEIQDIDAFSKLPVTTKKNYFDANPLQDLILGGELASTYLVCTSSGSSGKPHYWPRLKEQDEIEPALIEMMYGFLGLEGKSSLLISCLAMGSWVAANMMIDASLEIARKSEHKLSVITPGAANRAQILEIIQDLGPSYDQIILIGYPPTIRNLIVEGSEAGIAWKQFNPKFVVGGEPVTQHWKDFILKQVGSSNLTDIAVVFGMAEMHLVAYETPIASYIRALMVKHPKISRELFDSTTVGALLQFDPTRRWIEAENGSLLISARCGAPLLRYHSGDKGGVWGFQELIDRLKHSDIDILQVLSEAGFNQSEIWKWPFFFCNGRGDAISIMGANIYPDNIDQFFHHHPKIHDFKLAVEYTESQQPKLCVYLELRKGLEFTQMETDNFLTEAEFEIKELLVKNNDDYADAYLEEPLVMTPHVILCLWGSAPFEKKNVKQQHVLT